MFLSPPPPPPPPTWPSRRQCQTFIYKTPRQHQSPKHPYHEGGPSGRPRHGLINFRDTVGELRNKHRGASAHMFTPSKNRTRKEKEHRRETCHPLKLSAACCTGTTSGDQPGQYNHHHHQSFCSIPIKSHRTGNYPESPAYRPTCPTPKEASRRSLPFQLSCVLGIIRLSVPTYRNIA